MPAGLCAASSDHHRAAPHHLEPPRRGHRRERLLDQRRVDLVRAEGGAHVLHLSARHGLAVDHHRAQSPAPANASTAASAHAALPAWYSPNSGSSRSVVVAAQAADAQPLPADGEFPAGHPELQALAGHAGADLRRPAQQHLGRGERLLRQDGHRARLDDAGLLVRDLLDRVAEVGGVVEGDRGDHRDRAVGDVGRVPGAAEADLDHRHVHRRVGESGEGHPGERPRRRTGGPAGCSSTMARYGATSS